MWQHGRAPSRIGGGTRLATVVAMPTGRSSSTPSPVRDRREPALAVLVVLLATGGPAAARGLGTDLASLNFCLYGDCEARGTYAADPWGLYNPGVLALAVHNRMLTRGVALSGSYYHLEVGGIGGNIAAPVVTAAIEPAVFQVATAYAEADGPVRALPGVDMRFRTTAVRLAAGIDAERTLGIPGLCLGIAGVVPGTTTDVNLSVAGRRFSHSEETRALELIPGVHWHGLERDWLMIGAFADVLRNDVTTDAIDPTTGRAFHLVGTTNSLFARVGTSVLPFVPLRLADGAGARAEWLSAMRLGIDVEYRNIAPPGEGTTDGATAYFGMDVPLVPARWNPLAQWMQPSVLAGTDTRGGWGIGAGLYGAGVLRFLGCNPAYSSRPLVEVIGHRVDTFAITCTAMIPL
jgi:hypothetical protein